ncbi:MAG: nucleotide exchange factor GrpE [Verrucomicrobiae bacterium]|nr:nucleotide exchange factor GrpE [Verrucomicrobiae bacterium]
MIVDPPSPPLLADADIDTPPAVTEAAWKQALRTRFETWLADLDEPPTETPAAPEDGGPGLFSFQADLCALASEFRKSNRRSAEAMKQWSELMNGFQNELGRVTRRLDENTPADDVPAGHWGDLIEFADRCARVESAFGNPPPPVWLSRDHAWRECWERQHEAFKILAGHLRDLLRRAGISRVETLGRRLDPHTMRVVEAEHTDSHQPETVLREIRPGYLRNDRVLRLAEVTVAVPGTGDERESNQ